jgi:AraC-like DNA-binding protein
MPGRRKPVQADAADFSEVALWSRVGAGWRQLAGDFLKRGFSFEWHDFSQDAELDWGATFHPDSLELCLNLAGDARIESGGTVAELSPEMFTFYTRAGGDIRATRAGGVRHQFITVEYASEFLGRHLGDHTGSLHPLVSRAAKRKPVSGVAAPQRLSAALRQVVLGLRHPPVLAAAQSLWYQSKALELATSCLFQESEDLFCTRQQRLAQERVEAVIRILKRDLINAPPLEQISREVGCSPFYLSRTFSKELGTTIPQYLRKLRMERAAELLRAGRHNVTEAAIEVGYNSLSHFSAAFHETFGCCPGLYPMPMPRQKSPS